MMFSYVRLWSVEYLHRTFWPHKNWACLDAERLSNISGLCTSSHNFLSDCSFKIFWVISAQINASSILMGLGHFLSYRERSLWFFIWNNLKWDLLRDLKIWDFLLWELQTTSWIRRHFSVSVTQNICICRATIMLRVYEYLHTLRLLSLDLIRIRMS